MCQKPFSGFPGHVQPPNRSYPPTCNPPPCPVGNGAPMDAHSPQRDLLRNKSLRQHVKTTSTGRHTDSGGIGDSYWGGLGDGRGGNEEARPDNGGCSGACEQKEDREKIRHYGKNVNAPNIAKNIGFREYSDHSQSLQQSTIYLNNLGLLAREGCPQKKLFISHRRQIKQHHTKYTASAVDFEEQACFKL